MDDNYIPISEDVFNRPLIDLEPYTECLEDNGMAIGASEEFTATLDCDMSDLWYRLLPRGMANARILKRDGFLSPKNGVLE